MFVCVCCLCVKYQLLTFSLDRHCADINLEEGVRPRVLISTQLVVLERLRYMS